ncbi:MAG: peptide chain release factor N(5)-glutamine methyltransferase [Deltaproteobacteria bacterium]|nr:peptide chain release factor N(5)-glutamine methyltransferase [Deltaproteobacteria bacterium]
MNRPYTIDKLISWTSDYFKKQGIDSPRLDAELLLAHSLKVSRVQLYVDWNKPLQEAELSTFKTLLKARAAHEPLAYLIGEKEFFSLKFKVNPATLIPRPETEHLVEEGLVFLKDRPKSHLLDLATGSGCILLSLLKHEPSAQGLGVDISKAALEVAVENASHLSLSGQVKWQQLDLREAIDWNQSFDLITANLPYVSESEYQSLAEDIKKYEPKQALVPGPSGLESFDWVFTFLPKILKQGGMALFEIGDNQGEALLAKTQDYFPTWQKTLLKDLAGKDRVLKLLN